MKTIHVKDLMAISGKGGLFRFVAQARNGVIVESLADKKRTLAPATARVIALEDVAIFTKDEDLPLADVFMKIYDKEEGGKAPDPKSGNETLKEYFKEVIPDYDEEKVYVSDIKKVFGWYNILKDHDLLEVKEVEEEGDASGETKEEVEKEDGSPAEEEE